MRKFVTCLLLTVAAVTVGVKGAGGGSGPQCTLTAFSYGPGLYVIDGSYTWPQDWDVDPTIVAYYQAENDTTLFGSTSAAPHPFGSASAHTFRKYPIAAWGTWGSDEYMDFAVNLSWGSHGSTGTDAIGVWTFTTAPFYDSGTNNAAVGLYKKVIPNWNTVGSFVWENWQNQGTYSCFYASGYLATAGYVRIQACKYEDDIENPANGYVINDMKDAGGTMWTYQYDRVWPTWWKNIGGVLYETKMDSLKIRVGYKPYDAAWGVIWSNTWKLCPNDYAFNGYQ